MSRSYPRNLREGLCKRMLSGEKVTALSRECGICEGTLYRWKAQSKIDAGLKAGVKSYQSDELKRAKRRIADLEAELKITKDASDLFNSEVQLSPKGSARS